MSLKVTGSRSMYRVRMAVDKSSPLSAAFLICERKNWEKYEGAGHESAGL